MISSRMKSTIAFLRRESRNTRSVGPRTGNCLVFPIERNTLKEARRSVDLDPGIQRSQRMSQDLAEEGQRTTGTLNS